MTEGADATTAQALIARWRQSATVGLDDPVAGVYEGCADDLEAALAALAVPVPEEGRVMAETPDTTCDNDIGPTCQALWPTDRSSWCEGCLVRPPALPAGARELLSFESLRVTNKARCEAAFHKVDEWKPWEWSNALAGEVGEACNLTKKMNRIWPANQFKQNWNKPEDQRLDDLAQRVADEVADAVIYADLLLTSMGRSLAAAIVKKFNEKSDEIGSPIKLARDTPPDPTAALRAGLRQALWMLEEFDTDGLTALTPTGRADVARLTALLGGSSGRTP